MITRRDFVKTASATLAAATPLSAEILIQRTVRPVVISDYSGWEFKNGGTENAVQRAFRLITDNVLNLGRFTGTGTTNCSRVTNMRMLPMMVPPSACQRLPSGDAAAAALASRLSNQT